jgi:hypothetical protein
MMATVAEGSKQEQAISADEGRAEGIGTAPVDTDMRRLRRARTGRRGLLIVLAAFVLLGAATVFGVRTETVSASGGGYELTVLHPAVTRPGLAVRWIITVRHAGGFDGPVDIGITSRYMDLLDFNNLDALPSGTRTDGDMTIWTFDRPVGDTLVVAFDGRLEPAQQYGKPATVAVLADGVPVVSVHYDTRVMP